MPCYHPWTAYKYEDGSVRAIERVGVVQTLTLPCGNCIGCRLERSRQWAVRCMHEAQLHDQNSYITLTIEDDAKARSLDYRDFQLFMKRLRKFIQPKKIKFYCCGEYGETNQRAHYHAILFGYDFPDKKHFKKVGDYRLYTSDILQNLWGYGHCLIGSVTFDSAAYVARYVMKKVNGDLADPHYTRIDPETGEIYKITPEFNRMSLQGGIGKEWLDRYHRDVYPKGKIVVNGKEANSPRYYDKKYKDVNPIEIEDVQYARHLLGLKNIEHQTDERLKVREQVALAQINQLKRSI